jgi:hypothetical protein
VGLDWAEARRVPIALWQELFLSPEVREKPMGGGGG